MDLTRWLVLVLGVEFTLVGLWAIVYGFTSKGKTRAEVLGEPMWLGPATLTLGITLAVLAWAIPDAAMWGFLVFMALLVVLNRSLAKHIKEPTMRTALEYAGRPWMFFRHPIRYGREATHWLRHPLRTRRAIKRFVDEQGDYQAHK